ncbi:MAG: hypothetical protein K2G40_08990, partial [Muribaculaceae bacterium]|nr:hypothetical protein [Muribaculaceae bacterium]
NYTYHSSVSPYFKIGMDYNFLYNSNPDYRIFVGVRYGFTPFKWTLKNVTSYNNYWGEPNEIPFPDVNATAGYFEFLLGLRVNIVKNISMGWTVRYHSILHESPTAHGKAWYIPGYGSSTSPLSASLSVFYTIPLDKNRKKKQPQTPDILTPAEPNTEE